MVSPDALSTAVPPQRDQPSGKIPPLYRQSEQVAAFTTSFDPFAGLPRLSPVPEDLDLIGDPAEPATTNDPDDHADESETTEESETSNESEQSDGSGGSEAEDHSGRRRAPDDEPKPPPGGYAGRRRAAGGGPVRSAGRWRPSPCAGRRPRRSSFGCTATRSLCPGMSMGLAPVSAHRLGAVQRLADDVGVAGVLGRLGDDVQQHPAGRPACAGLEPGRLGQRVGGVEVGQRGDQLVGAPRRPRRSRPAGLRVMRRSPATPAPTGAVVFVEADPTAASVPSIDELRSTPAPSG